MAASRQRKQQANVIVYASDRDRHHRVLARDPAQVSMQSIPHLFPDCRMSSTRVEHQVNQAKYVTMRHENQPSLTGLVLLPIVPSTGSALDLRSHPAQLVCAEPYWAIIRSSLRDFARQTAVAARGLEGNAPRTELCACDPALDQQSGT